MSIEYRVNQQMSTEQFIGVLTDSTLAERRPVHDRECMAGMISSSNLTVSAWDGAQLVGISRCMTDFHYACYLSDLAVSAQYQNMGIGKQLLIRTQAQLGPRCKLILIAAPDANSYYEHLGFTHNPRTWVLERDVSI